MPRPSPWSVVDRARQPRPVAQIRAEIADLQRFLTDVPPHSGGSRRDDLQARLQRLRRELAAAERNDPDRR